jgi:hypothetical protein
MLLRKLSQPRFEHLYAIQNQTVQLSFQPTVNTNRELAG